MGNPRWHLREIGPSRRAMTQQLMLGIGENGAMARLLSYRSRRPRQKTRRTIHLVSRCWSLRCHFCHFIFFKCHVSTQRLPLWICRLLLCRTMRLAALRCLAAPKPKPSLMSANVEEKNKSCALHACGILATVVFTQPRHIRSMSCCVSSPRIFPSLNNSGHLIGIIVCGAVSSRIFSFLQVPYRRQLL